MLLQSALLSWAIPHQPWFIHSPHVACALVAWSTAHSIPVASFLDLGSLLTCVNNVALYVMQLQHAISMQERF